MPNQQSKRHSVDGDNQLTPVRKKTLTKTILDPADAEGRTVAAVFKPLEEKARISFFHTIGQPAEPKD